MKKRVRKSRKRRSRDRRNAVLGMVTFAAWVLVNFYVASRLLEVW